MNQTDLLAIYAAILSTVVFAWDVARARPKLTVKLIPGVKTIDDQPQSGIYIAVQNRTADALHLSNVSLLYPGRDVSLGDRLGFVYAFRRLPCRIGWIYASPNLYGLDFNLPIEVAPRSSCDFFVPNTILEILLNDAIASQLQASVQDKIWQNAYSNKLEIHFPGSETPSSRGGAA